MEKIEEAVKKKEFEAYERVRMGGRWNMLIDSRWAAHDANLPQDRYWAVLNNYSECAKKWKEDDLHGKD